MRALAVEGRALALRDGPDPVPAAGELLVEAVALGICATDREIVADGRVEGLILGHESLGRVAGTGELVVGRVRHPDPEPCGACARGQQDMCRNGGYTERGIRGLDGFGSTLWTSHFLDVTHLAPELGRDDIGVLVEPCSIAVKAWEQVRRIGARAWFEPGTVLVTGAGPIGQLAALLCRQFELDVHVLDRHAGGVKARLVRELGATYHHDPADEVLRRLRPDVVIETTGDPGVVLAALTGTAAFGVVCLTGVPRDGRDLTFDAAAAARELVLRNVAVVGSVNAGEAHYAEAAAALQAADPDWLAGLITRRVPLARAAAEALEPPGPDDVKTIVTF
ncbi:zinc-binding dehydrogenase [Dactylosporangium salmoneum]|uniref:Glucose 1-dehydrogenase n=1 Tax=Dactylosporangium salmoneum TaxID=53361 RepID=A0ABP5ULG6_9ACTN